MNDKREPEPPRPGKESLAPDGPHVDPKLTD
jgi:hypothetical protein